MMTNKRTQSSPGPLKGCRVSTKLHGVRQQFYNNTFVCTIFIEKNRDKELLGDELGQSLEPKKCLKPGSQKKIPAKKSTPKTDLVSVKTLKTPRGITKKLIS